MLRGVEREKCRFWERTHLLPALEALAFFLRFLRLSFLRSCKGEQPSRCQAAFITAETELKHQSLENVQTPRKQAAADTAKIDSHPSAGSDIAFACDTRERV